MNLIFKSFALAQKYQSQMLNRALFFKFNVLSLNIPVNYLRNLRKYVTTPTAYEKLIPPSEGEQMIKQRDIESVISNFMPTSDAAELGQVIKTFSCAQPRKVYVPGRSEVASRARCSDNVVQHSSPVQGVKMSGIQVL